MEGKEKRVKLGIDIGSLSQELLQVNRLVEENYKKSIEGQANYNAILEESIKLLEKQAKLVSQLGGDSQNFVVGSSDNNIKDDSLLHVIVDNVPLQVEIKGGKFEKEGEISINEIQKLLILIDKAKGANNSLDNQEEALDNEVESEENDILRSIKEDLDQIWEKFSEGITSPIPVSISNKGVSSDEKSDKKTREVSNLNNNDNNENNTSNDSLLTTIGNAFNGASALFNKDPNYILAGLVGMIPVIGAGLSSIVSKLIQEAEQKDISEHRFRGVSGGRQYYGSFSNIGLKEAEAYDRLSSYYSSNIYLKRTDLEFEKGFGVSSGIVSSLLKSFREDVVKNIGASVIGVNYLQGLRKIGGIEWKELRGYSEEYLKILVELNQKQLEKTGETNSIINSRIIQGISSLNNKFGDPTVLSKVVTSIESGLQQAKSPQMEALQYYALAQANPQASIWEMQMMKENPFGKESVGYFSNFLKGLLSTGNIQDTKFNIMNAFGLSAHQTEYLVNGILEAAKKNESIYQNKNGEFDLNKYLEGNFDISNIKEGKSYINNEPIYRVLPRLLREAGLNIRVTSGHRNNELGKSGNKSWHLRGKAVDIVPQGDTTYEDIEKAIYSDPNIYNYMLANEFGVLDESGRTLESKRLMKMTGATGSHFHFGKDVIAVKKYKNSMAMRGINGIDNVDLGEFSEAINLIENEANAATSEIQKMIARASDNMALAGEPLLKFTTEAVNTISDMAKKIPGFVDTASGFMTDFWGTFEKTVGGYFESLGEKITKSLTPNFDFFSFGNNPNDLNPKKDKK